MAGRISVVSHGVAIQLEVAEAAMLDSARRVLPPGATPTPWRRGIEPFRLVERDDGFEIAHGERALRAGLSEDRAFAVLDARIRAHLAVSAPRHVFVHAGVASRDGHAIVLPGISHSGKSTLVAALLRAGADYASDEFAVLDGDGLLWPFPRPISLRQPISLRDHSGWHDRDVAPAELGARCAAGPMRIGIVLLTEFSEGAVWAPKRLGRAAGVAALMANTPVARAQPDRVLSALSRAIADAEILESARAEAVEVAADLLRRIPRGRWRRRPRPRLTRVEPATD